jgi:predicted naringenin-chalcone synthase
VTTPAILALSTGVPEARYSQHDILEHLLSISESLNRRERAVRAIWARSGVGFRHSVVGEGYFAIPRTTQERNDFYMAEAVPLGEKTILAGLQRYGYQPADIDDFFVVSCTGYNTPGLDLQLAGRLGMRPDLNRTSILSMGCYGAFPGLRRAREAVRGQPGRVARVVARAHCAPRRREGPGQAR